MGGKGSGSKWGENRGRGREVRCVETGKIYDNAAAAARDMGWYQSLISVALKNGTSPKRSGYHFEYVDEENDD